MIQREILKGILIEQKNKLERLSKEEFVTRENLGNIKKFVGIKHSIVITGIRRCGKSVFLSQIINKFFKRYYFINFEDERFAGFDLEDFNKLYEICIELFGNNKTFFLDEVQNVKGWERWVRRMYDDGFKFFITGSNASLLSKELGTKLTGRYIQFSIFPFNFREFLKLCNFDFKKEDIYLTERRAIITKHFSDYSVNGGFPEYLKDKRIEILQEYFNDTIQRDIVERYRITNIGQLKELARYLITNSGNLMTYNQIKRLKEVKSINTVIKYLYYLENAYLVFKVPFFSYSLKRQTLNPFKVFAIDQSLITAVGFKFSKDFGRVYETIAAIELKRLNKEVYYWKNQYHKEVDFVVKEGLKIKQLIQVCYNIDDYETKKREIKALLKASKELKCKDLLIITEDKEDEEKFEGRKIRYIPLWKWLLVSKG